MCPVFISKQTQKFLFTCFNIYKVVFNDFKNSWAKYK